MNQHKSSALSSAQDLLDALIDVRQLVEQRGLGTSGFFCDSEQFSALMRGLYPGLKKESIIISALIDEGFLMRLLDVDAKGRVGISEQIKLWLDQEMDLKAEVAEVYSDVFLAFCNGETEVGTEAPQTDLTVSSSSSYAPSLNALRDVYANKLVGECFEFGRYPQGPNGEIKPITWRVLQREADYLLVIAEQGLEGKPYNTDRVSIDWAECTLRRWLNFEFYDTAFNEQERKCILRTRLGNNAGPKTQDRIFLLGVDEATRLFANDNARCVEPTEYAAKKSVYTFENGYCWWWLRYRRENGGCVACVDADGSIGYYGDNVEDGFGAVRPAFIIAL